MFENFENGSSSLICILLALYAFKISWNIIKTIYEYKKSVGNHVPVKGTIIGAMDIKSVKIKNQTIQTAYPIYSYDTNEDMRKNEGLVRYPLVNLIVGTKIPLILDMETGKLWNETEIPIATRQLIVRMVVTVILIVVAILMPKIL